MIIGPVGSGKTSLLSAILGETKCKEGQVNVCGSISYVAQQAWILNATLRDNILFSSEMNAEKYKTVLKNCCLVPDLKILQAKDMTEIGERGINLSGGQKQRISIARAVYADRDIVLLDDPLSAVDAHVGKALFENVILNMLHDKTRILVTHQTQYLSKADKILYVDNGKIIFTGTYDQLLRSDIDLSSIVHQQGDKDETSSTTESESESDDENNKKRDEENEKVKAKISEDAFLNELFYR